MYYKNLSKAELENELNKVKTRYDTFKNRGITLDMSRGKPGPEQRDVSSKMFDSVSNDPILFNINSSCGRIRRT